MCVQSYPILGLQVKVIVSKVFQDISVNIVRPLTRLKTIIYSVFVKVFFFQKLPLILTRFDSRIFHKIFQRKNIQDGSVINHVPPVFSFNLIYDKNWNKQERFFSYYYLSDT